ncbi:hypothetical protein E8E13_008984 [Curvularia kusanoi]|uniref:T6SS Phospholipase effector Tle1-like catalytic domain-containing protein n=1 Tax=Curvularia kusanoi TaxID=90978 RepID=A0A9P4TD04_CURKU|nr:hypothetical protein E8E13_008984 [Curvularia kusanoi]
MGPGNPAQRTSKTAPKTDQTRNWHQLVYYDGGIGTGNLNDLDKNRQGATGAGLEENVIEAYNFVVLNYQPGDEILCFGFSRGAYTARAVAGLIADVGVLKPLEMQFFYDVYRRYREFGLSVEAKRGKSFRDSGAWAALKEQGVFIDGVEPPEASRSIKVVGVWDTVGSLGLPDIFGHDNGDWRKQYEFHNVKLSKHVDHAYHALALDEKRRAFRPTLWYIDPKYNTNSELKQVWFPGVHINCGGGNNDAFPNLDTDMENISIATFTWMLQCIAPHVDLDQKGFNDYLKQYSTWLDNLRYRCTIIHPDILSKVINKIEDKLDATERDTLVRMGAKPHPHPNLYFGWGVGPIIDSYTLEYKNFNAPAYTRLPGNEEMETDGKWNPITGPPTQPTGFLTNEYIHPLVQHRREALKPALWSQAMNGWERKLSVEKDGSARYWWSKGSLRLPEWCILPNTEAEINYERTWYNAALEMARDVSKVKTTDAVEAAGGKDFLARLDAEIKYQPDLKPPRGNTWKL